MIKKISVLLIASLLLSACASGGKVVPRHKSYSSLSYGSVISSEEVTLGGSQSGIGSYAGSLAAVLDATSDSFLSIFARSIVGGIVGSSTEEVLTRKSGKEYRIEMSNGDIVVVASENKEITNGTCVQIARSAGRFLSVEPAFGGSHCLGNNNAQTSSA